MAEEGGLFELDNEVYTLKLNMTKVKGIERMLGVSFVAEVINSGGMLSFNMLDAIFSTCLYDTKEEKAVKGKKAIDIYNKIIEDIGYTDVMEVVVGKIEEDLGFLFR